MKTNPYTKQKHLELFNIFRNEFNRYYQHMEVKCRPELLKLSPSLFLKWYSSTLLDDTILSPKNIIDKDLSRVNKDKVCSYCLILDQNKRGCSKFKFRLNIYTAQKHPLIKDLITIMDYCGAHIRLDSTGLFFPIDKENLISRLSQYDEFYLEYLTRLLWEQELIIKSPSLHSFWITPCMNVDKFFNRPHEDILADLIDSGLQITSRTLTTALPIDWLFLTKDHFLNYLKEEQHVDMIFQDIYELMGIDIESLWSKSESEDLSLEDGSIISSFFFVGMLLDKWFLTPFAHFFHIIKPIYYSPFHFLQSINNITALLIMESDIDMELYSSCSYYSLTPIGDMIFNDAKKSESQQEIKKRISYEQIMATVMHELNLLETEDILSKIDKKNRGVFVFKIKYIENKTYWKILELPSEIPLSNFVGEICSAFNIEMKIDCTLTATRGDGLLILYAFEQSKKSVNKLENFNLKSLSLFIGETFTLSPTADKNNILELELIDISTENPCLLYPRIKRQSPNITKKEQEEDLLF